MNTPLPPAVIVATKAILHPRLLEEFPVALFEVAGRSFIEHQISLLRRNGITDVVLCIGRSGDMIAEHLGDGSAYGVSISYSFSDPALEGDAEVLRQALNLVGEEIFVLYGNSYLDCDYPLFYETFSAGGKPASIAISPQGSHSQWGNIALKNGEVLGYDVPHGAETYVDDGGLCLLRRDALVSAKTDQQRNLTDVFATLAERGDLSVFEATKRSYSIESPEDRVVLERLLAGQLLSEDYLGWMCPLCGSRERVYLMALPTLRTDRCTNCGLVVQVPPANTVNMPISAPAPANSITTPDIATEQEAAGSYIATLQERDLTGKSLLLVAELDHPIAAQLREAGYRVENHYTLDQFREVTLTENHFDAALMVYQLEKSVSPIATLSKIREALKPDGILLIVTPTLNSWSARFFGVQWTEWRPENQMYFNNYTIQAALIKSGFAEILTEPDRRRYSLEHLYHRARAFPQTTLTRTVQFAYRILPGFFRHRRIRLPASGLVVAAKRVEKRERPLLSIVMPVYNEKATFEQTLQAVLAKTVPGVDKQVIIVESNSTDGSREIALQYKDHPEVKLLLENRPRGKGHAVRLGLQHATGNYILIQDADAEYDVNDYDALVNVLRRYRVPFVLGSRHSGTWKMRQFTDQPGTAVYFNVGHTFFTTLFNTLYGQSLKDPFTMYKVFWRECLYGLEFECNRFDFDIELVAKLVRKGYPVLEIPVNYRSRSLQEGKKVSLIRDPLTWIYADIKYRVSPLEVKSREDPRLHSLEVREVPQVPGE